MIEDAKDFINDLVKDYEEGQQKYEEYKKLRNKGERKKVTKEEFIDEYFLDEANCYRCTKFDDDKESCKVNNKYCNIYTIGERITDEYCKDFDDIVIIK